VAAQDATLEIFSTQAGKRTLKARG